MTTNNIKFGYVYQVQKNSLEFSLISNLQQSTITLCNIAKPCPKNTCRGKGLIYYFGYWTNYSIKPYETKDSKQVGVRQWWWTNYNLWKFIGNLVKKYFPIEYNLLVNVKFPFKFGIFTNAGINANYPCEPHYDTLDNPAAVCVIIVFGIFLGGEFCVEDDCVYVPNTEGTIIILKSATKKHFVANYIGYRNSIVLFTPKTMFKY